MVVDLIIQKILLDFDRIPPMSVGDLGDVRLEPPKSRQSLVKFE